jgi:hypothetical protein
MRRMTSKRRALCACAALSLIAGSLAPFPIITASVQAQDEDSGGMADDGGGDGEIIVTAMRRQGGGPVAIPEKPPVIGLKRKADGAVRAVEILSDSLEEDVRQREVRTMLLSAIDRAKQQGLSIVVGNYEISEVTRENAPILFPALFDKEDPDAEDEDDDDDDYDDDEDENAPKPAYEDDGNTTTIRLKIKTKLDGTIDNAQRKISIFAKAVPVSGRSLIKQKGVLALTLINPEQYREEIYKRIATGAKYATTFYGPDYHIDVTGLDRAIAWKQVSNTELFLYIPYSFVVGK